MRDDKKILEINSEKNVKIFFTLKILRRKFLNEKFINGSFLGKTNAVLDDKKFQKRIQKKIAEKNFHTKIF